MSEKSGYGTQLFILIVALVLVMSLSRVKGGAASSESEPTTGKAPLTHVDHLAPDTDRDGNASR